MNSKSTMKQMDHNFQSRIQFHWVTLTGLKINQTVALFFRSLMFKKEKQEN